MKRLAIIFTSVTLFYVAFYVAFPVTFEDNDDVMMLMISSGIFTGFPDEHLIFTNILIGYVLKFFYSITTSIEWYSLHLMLAHIIALSIIITVLLEIKTTLNKFGVLTSLITLLVFSTYFILRIQFTTTAFFLATAGFLLLYHIFLDNTRLNLKRIIVIVILIVWASLIRFEVLFAVCIVLFPFFVVKLKNKFFFLLSSLITVIIFSFYFLNYGMYRSDKSWAYYVEFNKIRATVNSFDNPNVKYLDVNSVLKTSNLTSEEIRLFKDNVFPTKNINIETLKVMNQNIPKRTFLSIDLDSLKSNLKSYWKEIFFLLTLGILFYFSANNEIRVLWSIVLFLFLFVFLGLNGIPKSRVFFGLFYVLTTFIIYHLLHKKTISYGFDSLLLGFILLFNFVMFANRLIVYYKQNKILIVHLKKELQCIEKQFTYIPIADALGARGISPLNVTTQFQEKKILFTGWLMASPIYNKKVEKYFGNKYQGNEMELLEKIAIENHHKIRFIGTIPEDMKVVLLRYSIKIYNHNKICNYHSIKLTTSKN